jgi:hypothetical protein
MTLVTVLFSLAGFVALVGLLASKNAHRTSGRACCAPAYPGKDLRMRAAGDDPVSLPEPTQLT